MKALWMACVVLVATLIVAASLRAQTSPAPATQPRAAANVETGKKLYVSYGCYQCHGYEGQGGAAGPRLAHRSLPLAGFTSYTRRPTNQMPPYSEKLVPDAELEQIHAYVQSLPAPPPPGSIPLLQK